MFSPLVHVRCIHAQGAGRRSRPTSSRFTASPRVTRGFRVRLAPPEKAVDGLHAPVRGPRRAAATGHWHPATKCATVPARATSAITRVAVFHPRQAARARRSSSSTIFISSSSTFSFVPFFPHLRRTGGNQSVRPAERAACAVPVVVPAIRLVYSGAVVFVDGPGPRLRRPALEQLTVLRARLHLYEIVDIQFHLVFLSVVVFQMEEPARPPGGIPGVDNPRRKTGRGAGSVNRKARAPAVKGTRGQQLPGDVGRGAGKARCRGSAPPCAGPRTALGLRWEMPDARRYLASVIPFTGDDTMPPNLTSVPSPAM